MAIVSFIGAGPGDPELITLKAINRIRAAGLILYAGSLVPENVFMPYTGLTPENIISSADLTLEETHDLVVKAIEDGKNVARIHTGDPSMYGAISEQMALLDRDIIEYEVIPGVSSAMAAAAVLKTEFTFPDITQTAIFTRIHGKTPVPEKEDLAKLAKHQATMVIFLSTHRAKAVEEKLLDAYPANTPAVIAYRVGWPDQMIIHTTIEHISDQIKYYNLNRQALIMVGHVFDNKTRTSGRSVLYGKDKRQCA
ncbi:MAG: precorrin-4 C(11)-methyltransferase [Deltaproteobacteria bacterium]|nr:precorrin-4 C(11)-methyltransferase [Deltaproteobacteria bacterium]